MLHVILLKNETKSSKKINERKKIHAKHEHTQPLIYKLDDNNTHVNTHLNTQTKPPASLLDAWERSDKFDPTVVCAPFLVCLRLSSPYLLTSAKARAIKGHTK